MIDICIIDTAITDWIKHNTRIELNLMMCRVGVKMYCYVNQDVLLIELNYIFCSTTEDNVVFHGEKSVGERNKINSVNDIEFTNSNLLFLKKPPKPNKTDC